MFPAVVSLRGLDAESGSNQEPDKQTTRRALFIRIGAAVGGLALLTLIIIAIVFATGGFDSKPPQPVVHSNNGAPSKPDLVQTLTHSPIEAIRMAFKHYTVPAVLVTVLSVLVLAAIVAVVLYFTVFKAKPVIDKRRPEERDLSFFELLITNPAKFFESPKNIMITVVSVVLLVGLVAAVSTAAVKLGKGPSGRAPGLSAVGMPLPAITDAQRRARENMEAIRTAYAEIVTFVGKITTTTWERANGGSGKYISFGDQEEWLPIRDDGDRTLAEHYARFVGLVDALDEDKRGFGPFILFATDDDADISPDQIVPASAKFILYSMNTLPAYYQNGQFEFITDLKDHIEACKNLILDMTTGKMALLEI